MFTGQQENVSEVDGSLYSLHSGPLDDVHSFFFYKNLFYKNVETEI